jgi:sporulation protein YlmC with PRC-barrel domain
MAAIMPVGVICGADVAGADGETLGTISELMIDAERGGIAYAVLAYGGVLGVGEKLFALPWRVFEVEPASGAVSLSIPRERFESLPGFDKDAWPTEPDPAFG